MYDKKYAEAWIQNHEAGNDTARKKYLEPFLERELKKLPGKIKILDAGCGWGMIIPFIGNREYYGFDPSKDLLRYVKNNYRRAHLKQGSLPTGIRVSDHFFDFVLCSLVLHTVTDIEKSLDFLFKKTKPGGKILIVEFRDEAEKVVRKCYEDYEEGENHIKGTYILPSGLKIKNETFFHSEKKMEALLKKYGSYSKKYLGSMFVSYLVELG